MVAEAEIEETKRTSEEEPVCSQCGKGIPAEAKFCPSCRAPIVRRYCPACGKLVPENSKFCFYCRASSDAVRRTVLNFPIFPVVVLGLALFILSLSNLPQPDVPNNPGKQQIETSTTGNQPPAIVQHAVVQHAAQPVQTEQDLLQSNAEGTRLNLEAHKLMAQGRYEEAIPILKRALKTFPDKTSSIDYKFALYNLGHSLRRAGRVTESVPYLQQTVEMDSQWDKARQELQIATMKLRNTQPEQNNN